MGARGTSRSLRRYWPDALTGLATFAITLLIAGGSNTVSAASGAEPIGFSNSGALLAAAAFAITAALNMSFFRYIYRTYAMPRRIAARRRALRSARGS